MRLSRHRGQIAPDDASPHQGNKLAAAGNFEFAEDCVNVLFHRRQTQAGVIGDFSRAALFSTVGGKRNYELACSQVTSADVGRD